MRKHMIYRGFYGTMRSTYVLSDHGRFFLAALSLTIFSLTSPVVLRIILSVASAQNCAMGRGTFLVASIAVLLRDLSVLVAMPTIESWLFHRFRSLVSNQNDNYAHAKALNEL